MGTEVDESEIRILNSYTFVEDPGGQDRPSGWLKLGAVAAASALAGGLAAAWWYRNTLKKLRESGENGENTQFGISNDPASENSRFDI